MTFKRLLPFIIVTIGWSIYVGLAHGVAIALGIFIITIAIAYIQPVIAIGKSSSDFDKKRFNGFIIVWAVVMIGQIIFFFLKS
ncbi:MAG TPA: hypothetical protein VK658_02875 [Chryseolinea sp.]|nr:hypothetical protein [Chryseolinea sp.]